MTDPSGARRPQALERADQHLKQAVWQTRLSLGWERLWPAVARFAGAIGLFLAASWAGLWVSLPPMGKVAMWGVFVVLLAWSARPLMTVGFLPGVREAMRRLDRTGGEPHRPATALRDTLAVRGEPDPFTRALWQAHLERTAAAVERVRAKPPRPRLFARDPFALRVLVVLLMVPAFFMGGDERLKRVVAAFDLTGALPPANYRVDAWIAPPNYTGRPPVLLPGLRAGEARADTSAAVAVPVGSVLVVRATGLQSLTLLPGGGLEPAPADARNPVPQGVLEQRLTIRADGTATIRQVGEEDLVWRMTAIPDKAPVVTIVREPEVVGRGAIAFGYKVEDDYGIVRADVRVRPSAPPRPGARPLFEAPDFQAPLPGGRARTGVAQVQKDLTEHPWAGADVDLVVVARDEAGNEGTSAPAQLRLPQRRFAKPVARAVVEQRRALAMDATAKPRVARALDTLTLWPERFRVEPKEYLALRSAFWRLQGAVSDDELKEVVAYLWQVAVGLEEGTMAEAEQALRDAEEKLREALERGATDEEIRKLTQDLREALDRFMQQMAEEMRRNPTQPQARQNDPNSRNVRPQDLQNLIDRIENLARSGSRDAARQLLSELQSILEGLQNGRPQESAEGEEGDGQNPLDDLGNMIQEQQRLRDRTYREGQQNRRNQPPGQRQQRPGQPQQGQQPGQQPPDYGDLSRNQQALREQLEKLMEEMRRRGQMQQGQQGQQGQQPGQQPGQQGQRRPGQGQQPGQGGQPGGDPGSELGAAERAMRDAERALGQGNADGAVDQQGRALEALRRGAQSLADQMAQEGQQGGPGQQGRPGQAQNGQRDTDPLGRPLRGRDFGDDTTVKVPGEMDVQRARRILEELRRRYGDTLRSQQELDYIERLLRDF